MDFGLARELLGSNQVNISDVGGRALFECLKHNSQSPETVIRQLRFLFSFGDQAMWIRLGIQKNIFFLAVMYHHDMAVLSFLEEFGFVLTAQKANNLFVRFTEETSRIKPSICRFLLERGADIHIQNDRFAGIALLFQDLEKMAICFDYFSPHDFEPVYKRGTIYSPQRLESLEAIIERYLQIQVRNLENTLRILTESTREGITDEEFFKQTPFPIFVLQSTVVKEAKFRLRRFYEFFNASTAENPWWKHWREFLVFSY